VSRARPLNLRRAAAIIFALVAVLPLLLFVLVLAGADLLGRTEAQVGLLLALLIALLGYVVFQRMVGRIAELTRALDAGLGGEGAARPPAAVVPGLGHVSELGEMAQAFGRMLEELRASTERLEDLVFKLGTLNEMVELAAKIPKIQDLLADVLDRTMRAVHARIGSIMLLDRERQVLKVVVARGLPEDVPGAAEVRVGEGVAGRAVELGEPVLVEDIEADPRFGKVSEPRYGGGSFICMPLRVGDRVIGVVNLARKELVGGGTRPPFSRTDLQFLNTLMTYTAYAVDNARLLEEAQQAARRLREVVEDQKLRLTLAQQQMVQAAKLSALGELVAGVAHELNNPLAVLSGIVELLEEDAPEALRPRVQAMQASIEKAARIVRDLLTFARRRPLQRERVDVAAIVERTLELTSADLGLSGVRVERDVAPDLPPIWADPHGLEQVLVNLVTNARQAMAEVEGPRVLRIALRPSAGGGVSVTVEDTGPGIAPELLPAIFDPFVTTKGVHGTGLGLSISYGIIREHGGEIRAENPPGGGARFVVELPRGEAVGAAAAVAAPPRTLAGRRVLVVEDDAMIQEIVRRHLEREGCEALTAATAEEALARLGEPIHVVVSNVHLPGMSGLSFYREAVGRQPALAGRFLFLTGGPLPESAQGMLGDHPVCVLQKPFTRQRLLEAIREVLG
jgi:signal transduction histidine kinase/HAMP domain-containing protein